jgi:hypothetical protein
MGFTTQLRALGASVAVLAAMPELNAQIAPVPARSLSVVEVTRLCTELERWFKAYDDGFTSVARQGGTSAWPRFADTTFSDSADYVVKGSGTFVFFSRRTFVDSVNRIPADTTPDRHFEFRPAGTSVGIMSSTRALYVRRYMEIDSASVARGMTRVYAGMEAGTLVRTPVGWRQLERVNSTGSLGVIDSVTSRVRPWQCR